MNGGRPLRFLAVLLGGWAMARGTAIYRDGIAAIATPIERIATAIANSFAADATPLPGQAAASPRVSLPAARPIAAGPAIAGAFLTPYTPSPVAAPTAAPSMSVQDAPAPPAPWPITVPRPIARGASRLAGSTWMIARNGGPAVVSGSQLGASQAGVRITYALGAARRLALSARLSAPLSGRGKEAAVGLDWQPTRAPIHVVAEQRLALDGGRGGPTLSLVGGFGPTPVAAGFRLEGYGQAGVIARDGGEAFADGAVRASHPLRAFGPIKIDIGFGAWGGTQRGASRLDVGPSLGIALPLGRRSIRLTADWRERLAGQARPGSGPALSIGTDF